MKLISSAKKLVVVALFALVGLSAMAGSASAAADGDLDLSTAPPRAEWRINVAHVQINPEIQAGGFVVGR
jgi:hypothetical protein